MGCRAKCSEALVHTQMLDGRRREKCRKGLYIFAWKIIDFFSLKTPNNNKKAGIMVLFVFIQDFFLCVYMEKEGTTQKRLD